VVSSQLELYVETI